MRCLAAFFCLALFGCSASNNADPANTQTHHPRPDAGSGGSNGSGGADTGGTSAGGASSSGGAAGQAQTVSGKLGIVAIDVQETFVSGAHNADLSARLDRTKSDFQLAADQGVPFFITFEATEQGDHALYAPLQPVLPSQAQKFIKTTFDATGLPAFAAAMQQSGLTHLVVVGSETDVCVMQTVLGLRKLGFTVLVEGDAVFTSETNTSPAVRRMQQAGAVMVDQNQVQGFVANPNALPKGQDVPVTILAPLSAGVVFNAFDDASVGATPDPLKTQKAARLQQLLLVSEWFELPVYVANPTIGLPSAYASYFHGQLLPISQIAQDAAVTELVVAGTDGGLSDALTSWKASHQLYVMEDALFSMSSPDAQKAMLEPFYAGGIVPTTYKSFYYDMTKSVDPSGWPSQVWVQRFDPYYDLTMAPEDLPPMPPS